MRRMLRILKWLGLSLSTLLLIATFVLWTRSAGHDEEWKYRRVDNGAAGRKNDATHLVWAVRIIPGRLRISVWTFTRWYNWQSGMEHEREAISPERIDDFHCVFTPDERHERGRIAEVRTIAGVRFAYHRSPLHPKTHRPVIEGHHLALPFWMLAVVFGLWPVGFVAWRLLRKKRHAPGHCPACGYDLRATPDPSGPRLPRCPECGREGGMGERAGEAGVHSPPLGGQPKSGGQ